MNLLQNLPSQNPGALYGLMNGMGGPAGPPARSGNSNVGPLRGGNDWAGSARDDGRAAGNDWTGSAREDRRSGNDWAGSARGPQNTVFSIPMKKKKRGGGGTFCRKVKRLNT